MCGIFISSLQVLSSVDEHSNTLKALDDGDILSIYDDETGVLTQQFVYDSDLGWVLK